MGSLPKLLESMKSGVKIQIAFKSMVKLEFGEQTKVRKEEVKVGALDAWRLNKIKIRKFIEMKMETTSLIAKNAVKMWE